jgi:protein gp37
MYGAAFDRPWPRNAAIGTTVEDQKRADANIPALINAKVELSPAFAFLSCEPLLGPINLDEVIPSPVMWSPIHGVDHTLDWIITGGETDQGSHKARPPDPRWFRSLRDQAAAAGIPFHHKQNGEFIPDDPGARHTAMCHVGKKAAGRLLDGVLHDARPAVR